MDDWIAKPLTQTGADTRRFRKAQRIKKFCQWVENATAPRVCAGLVGNEGTIYCPYHSGLWLEMSRDAEKRDMMRQLDGLPSRLYKRKPEVED